MAFVTLILVLFPLVYLLNSKLAFVALVGAIVWMVYDRTYSPKPRRPKRSRSEQPEYQAGYEN